MERLPFRCLPVVTHPKQGHPVNELRTALREAAYIRRTRFTKGDVTIHDFSSRAEDLFMLTSIVPDEAPEWVHRPFLRWQLADEAIEASGDLHGVRAWHVCGDLRPGLSRGEWMDQVVDLVRSVLPAGIVAEIAGHIPRAGRPPHVHILISSRYFGRRTYAGVSYPLYRRLNGCLRQAWVEWACGDA
ncbi:MobA/MobL family protein [Sphingomonas sediminicola]